MMVYKLWHEFEVSPGIDSTRLIGIYSSRENAERALTRARNKPGFREHPDGFEISEALVDRDGWIEGFAWV